MYLLQATTISRSARMRLKIPPATLDSSNVKFEVEFESYSVVWYYECISVTNHFIQCVINVVITHHKTYHYSS